MEEWKLSVLIGAGLIILALIFGLLRKEFSILIMLVIVLGAVDVIFGLYRKKN
ncbi:hypothetical protein [Methanobrevibacter sp.]|uniref:hypothetical protein n=1 Tax=Methanobrevibacter sp. TaxID=66852 RepID=UPI0025EC5967|nr:hypothetical protein [Methanobrevibacter sp.]